MDRSVRTAHPYDDTDVIDERAPRFNQATVAILSALTLVTGWWAFVALLALQLGLGLTFGRRWCLPCVFYFEVIQPRLGEGAIEDARPPRFANVVGAVFLGSATAAFALGATLVGNVLTGAVAALAALAAVTGLCVGCEIYRIGARLRGVRPGGLDRVDLAEIGVDARRSVVVHFTHPLCSGCNEVAAKLHERGEDVIAVDVSRRPELARKYHVTVVPTTVAVDRGGRVTARLA